MATVFRLSLVTVLMRRSGQGPLGPPLSLSAAHHRDIQAAHVFLALDKVSLPTDWGD
jgi:hypothetical protein